VTANFRLIVVAGAAILILVGAFRLWQDEHPAGRGDGRLLVLDARTGRTLHERSFSGGWIVAAVLTGGRVAVADLDSCPDGVGGQLSVWDASLERKLSGHAAPACEVSRLDPASLRRRMGDETAGLGPDFNRGIVTIPLGQGKIVQTESERTDPSGTWLTRATAYDAGGRVLWRRSGRILGIADARAGQVLLPIQGDFTPGTD
jgi:hypothetical protein